MTHRMHRRRQRSSIGAQTSPHPGGAGTTARMPLHPGGLGMAARMRPHPGGEDTTAPVPALLPRHRSAPSSSLGSDLSVCLQLSSGL